MKKWCLILLLFILSSACKEKLYPELVGIWQLTEVKDSTKDWDSTSYRVGSRIEFKKNGIIDLGTIDCYCSHNNSYKLSGNTLFFTYGEAGCYPFIDCPRPVKATIIQIDSQTLILDWILPSRYPENFNYQAKFKRI